MIYAVIDTNVFVSALFTKNIESATIKVLNALLEGKIVPLYNNDPLAELNFK
jgi:predicted nucleic acid-binding protein